MEELVRQGVSTAAEEGTGHRARRFVGGIIGAVGFAVYGRCLLATQTNFSLNGGPGVVVMVCLGALVGRS